jgi:hypothetical protein
MSLKIAMKKKEKEKRGQARGGRREARTRGRRREAADRGQPAH